VREYEILVIVDPDVEDAAVDGVVERITKIVTDAGGQVANVDKWGRRKLAYEIDHKTEGVYVLVTFTSDTPAVDELERVLLLADEVTRFKVVRKVVQTVVQTA